jgi:hypothetical protein
MKKDKIHAGRRYLKEVGCRIYDKSNSIGKK